MAAQAVESSGHFYSAPKRPLPMETKVSTTAFFEHPLAVDIQPAYNRLQVSKHRRYLPHGPENGEAHRLPLWPCPPRPLQTHSGDRGEQCSFGSGTSNPTRPSRRKAFDLQENHILANQREQDANETPKRMRRISSERAWHKETESLVVDRSVSRSFMRQKWRIHANFLPLFLGFRRARLLTREPVRSRTCCSSVSLDDHPEEAAGRALVAALKFQ